MKRNLRKNCNRLYLQRGASLLEGIAYLGVAAVVVLGAVSLLTSAFSSAQTNRAIEEIISIRTAVAKVFMAQGGAYGGSAGTPAPLNATMINVRGLPGSLAVSGTDTLTNAWGGAVTIEGRGANFSITYAGLPAAECISLLMGANGWVSVQQGARTPVTTFPITAANAATECDGDPANTLRFISS